MIIRILTIAFAVVIAAFLSPQWIGYAIVGTILGLVIGLAIRLFRRPRNLRLILSILGVVCGVALIFSVLTPSLQKSRLASPPLTLAVDYTASISPLEDAAKWQIHEEFLISKTEWLNIFQDRHSGIDEASKNEMNAIFSERLTQNLEREKWENSGFVGAKTQFRRTREFQAPAKRFSATTRLVIPIKISESWVYNSLIRLVPDAKSTVVITSPKYIVASTFPAHSSRVDALGDDQERLAIPLAFSRLEQPEVRIAILSPLLRWPLGPKIGSFSLWSAVQWLLLGLCAVFSEQIKEKWLKPMAALLFSSKKRDGNG